MAVSLELFGRDHWSTFAYLGSVITGRGGVPEKQRMRCDRDRHPRHDHAPTCLSGKYPTRLGDGSLLHDHDDWDCAEDLTEAGLLLSKGTGIHPRFDLTEEGWKVLRALLAHNNRSDGGQRGFGSFRWPEPAPTQEGEAA